MIHTLALKMASIPSNSSGYQTSSAVVITRSLPIGDQAVHGVFQRLDLLVRSLLAAVQSVHCLFLISKDIELDARDISALEQRLRSHWGRNLQITVAPVLDDAGPKSLWMRFGAGIFDAESLPVFLPFRGAAVTRAIEQALASEPNLVLAHRLPVMMALRRHAQRLKGVPICFDMDDIEHVAQARRLLKNPSWPSERLRLLQIPSLMLAERRAIGFATTTFVCSETDQKYLLRQASNAPVEILPNCVDLPSTMPADTMESLVLFVGSFSYEPNIHAASWLCRDIWPRIRRRVPEARLLLVGKGSESLRRDLPSDSGIELAGFVPDIAAVYRRAQVVCCPIRSGGGTRVKIIEAAAYGKAVVSTAIGAEGLAFRAPDEILIESGADRLATACIGLLQHPANARLIGINARKRVEELYDRRIISARLTASYSDLISAKAGAPV